MAASRKATYIFAIALTLAVLGIYLPGIRNELLFDDLRLSDGTIFGEYGSLLQFKQRLLSYGSFVWLLDATDTDPAQVVLLAKANPQSAFGLLADPSVLTEDCVKTLAACRNLVVMPLLQTPELTPEACRAARRLKAQKMFYALTVLIDDETAGEVMQDDWLESMAQETLCCMCARKPGTSDETARKLRRSIVNGRLETGKPVLLLDWDGDVRYLNNRISEYMTFGSVLPEGSTFPLQLG